MAQQQHKPVGQRSVVDLTIPDDEVKRRLVGSWAPRPQQPSQQRGPVTIEISDSSDEEVEPRSNRTAHDGGAQEEEEEGGSGKRQCATQRGGDEQRKAAPEPQQQSFPEPVLYPMRDVLKAAHQERIRRMQQRQQLEAEDDEMAGTTPAAGQQQHAKRSDVSEIFKGPLAAGKRRAGGGDVAAPGTQARPQPDRPPGPATVKVLTFNIWFEEPVALRERMRGFVDVVLSLEPDVIMLQEVTHNMIRLWFEEHAWLAEQYTFSPPSTDVPYYTMLAFRSSTMRPLATNAAQAPLLANAASHMRFFQRWSFGNSRMGRDLLSVPLQPSQHPSAPPLLVATSHLESPLGPGPDKNMATKRAEQLALALLQLGSTAAAAAELARPQAAQRQPARGVDVLWGGDMNWNKHNCDPELPDGWEDVWASHPEACAPGEPLAGFTYDPKRNATIAGSRFPPARLDRFFARLEHWRVESMRLVGTEPLPGVTATHYSKQVKVHISDHFGILLELRWDGHA